MTKFTEASERLKDAIETITASKLSYNDAGLDHLDTSKQLFANPDLLPKSFPAPHISTYTLPDHSEYSQKALQAVWNVAHLTNNIATSHIQPIAKLTNNPALFRNLQYLSDDLAPKVIDYTTYALGLALMDFLDVVTTDKEAIAALPQEPLRAMIAPLQTRLDVFSAHLPEKRAQLEIVDAFKIKIAAFRSTFEKIEWLKLAATDPQDLQSLDKAILDHNQIIADFEQQLINFETMLTDWLSEHSSTFPGGTVVSSKFYELSADKSQQDELLDLWKGLFNRQPEPDFLVTSNPYESGVDLLQQGQVALEGLKQQVATFQARRETFTQLFNYEEELASIVQQTKDLDLPEFLKQTENGLVYQIQLSSADNRKIALEADRESYAELIKQLRAHSEKLGELQSTLQQQYDNFAHPAPIDPTDIDHALFATAREKALVQLLDRIKTIQQQRDTLQELVLEAASAQTAVSKSILQLTLEGRREITNNLGNRIRYGFIEEQKLSKKLSFQQIHVDGAKAENEIYTRITDAATERRKFLEKADAALAAYAEAISESTIYVPASTVPKDHLKRYLEASEAATTLIDRLYQNEKDAGAWYGFNMTAVFNRLNHHSSLLMSDQEYDLEELGEFITAKRERIKEELAVDITVPGNTPAYTLSGVNLYALREQYQQHAKSTFLEIQWADAEINHKHAMVDLFLHQLNFKLEDIKDTQGQLENLVEKLAKANTDETLQLLRDNKNLIGTATVWFTFKHKWQDESSESLLENAGNYTRAAETAWKKLEKLLPLSQNRLPTPLRQSLEHFQEERQQLSSTFNAAKEKYDALAGMLNKINTIKLTAQVKKLNELASVGVELVTQAENAEQLELTAQEELWKLINQHFQVLSQQEEFLGSISTIRTAEIAEPFEAIQKQQASLLKTREHLFNAIEMAKHVDEIKSSETISTMTTAEEIFIEKVEDIESKYFNPNGVFGTYLAERANTYFWRDFFSQCAAFLLRFTGYQPEKNAREVFVSELKSAMLNYKNDTSSYNDLEICISKGVAEFSPRDDSDVTLRAKLTSFQHDLVAVNKFAPKVKDVEERTACTL